MKYYFYKVPGSSLGLTYVMAGNVSQCSITKEDGENLPEFEIDDILVIYSGKPSEACNVVLKSVGQNFFRKIIEVAPGALYNDLPQDIQETISLDDKTYWEISEEQYKKILSLMVGSVGLLPDVPKGKIAHKSEQKIFYGTPGSGKSFKVKKDYDEKYPKEQVVRTTFHPDTDYASFVGGYKPVETTDKAGNEKISYRFVPQCFTEAYVRAWNDLGNPYFLIIEEINRGNCAQIFGDTFQLLDRNENGYSEYPIDADADLKKYLEEDGALTNKAGIANGQLCLPPNLSIIATMNTSDQSLFPMDTAFKRRWAWEYVPIEYENEKSSQFKIKIGEETFDWPVFLKAVNKEIKRLTSSEDKQMGNFFIKHSVDEKEFINKVMYYLWSEVGKDNYQTSDALFLRYADGNDGSKTDFSFNELYEEGKTKKLLDFMHIIIDNKEA